MRSYAADLLIPLVGGGVKSRGQVKTKLLAAALLLATAPLLAACGSATGPEVGEEFELRVGERATLAELRLYVRFIQVTDDSRCPTRAECVWAGDGAVLLEIAPQDGDAYELTLHTLLDPKVASLGGVELSLVRLDPYPESPGSILPHEYVVTLTTRATPPEPS